MFVQTAESAVNPRNSELHSGSNKEAIDIKFLDEHQDLFCEGDRADSFYEVLDGIICCYKILLNGGRHIVSFNFPGDIIGFSSGERHNINAEALNISRVRRIKKQDLSNALRKDPQLGDRLLKIAAKKIAHLQNQNASIGRKTALERVASFLLVFARREQSESSEKIKFTLPMTRTDIADYLGLTIETVCRALSKIKKSQVIDLPQNHLVIVNDINALEELSECDGGRV